jgi:hypothetical protein
MGAITVTTVLSNELNANTRKATLLLTLPASYDTGGSVLDLSAVTGGGFTKVYGVTRLGVSPAANDKYHLSFVPAASYAPSTPVVKIRDLSAASDAEVASTTDLSATTVVVEVTGV